MQSNFFLGFSTFFDMQGSKTRFLGSGTIANASGSKFGAGSRSPCPKLNFPKPFHTKFDDFSPFLQCWFLGPSAFLEFTNFYKGGVYTISHAHQWMRLEKLLWNNKVSARDLEYEIKIFQQAIFKSVRGPFSSWSDRKSFQLFLWVITGLNFRIIRVFGIHTFLHPLGL